MHADGNTSVQHHANWTVNLWGVPDWSVVSEHWTLAWMCYVYVFCMIYLIILGFDLIVYAKFQRRFSRQRLLSLLLLYVTVSDILLFGFHVVDPYGYYNRIPKIITRVFWKLPYPLIVGTFCLLQMVIMKLTRLDIPSIQINGYHFLIISTVIYSFEILVIESLVYFSKISPKLAFITDGIYVIFSVYLCCCFTYGAPKVSRYASEAQRAKKELSNHSLSKIDAATSDERRNKPRINYPRLRTNFPSNRVSLLSDDSSGSDSKHESSFIEQRMAVRREKTAAFAVWYKNTFSKQRHAYNKSWRSQNSMCKDNKTKLKTCNSSGSFDGSMTLQEYSSVNDDSENERRSFRLPNSSSHDLISKSEVPKTSIRNRACRERHNADIIQNVAQETKIEGEICSSAPILLNPSVLLTTNETKIYESGYIADVERLSIHSDDNENKKSRASRHRKKPEENISEASLPNSSSFLSFQRLRQGQMLNELLKYTYALTAFVMLSCLGSVYGILNLTNKELHSKASAHPVYWLIINYFQRFMEAAILLLCTAAVHTSVSFRSHKIKRKRMR